MMFARVVSAVLLLVLATSAWPHARMVRSDPAARAVLSRLARYVYSVERYRSLLVEAEARLRVLKIENVITKHGDGGLGWAEQAPFDRIMVTAASPTEPTEGAIRSSSRPSSRASPRST